MWNPRVPGKLLDGANPLEDSNHLDATRLAVCTVTSARMEILTKDPGESVSFKGPYLDRLPRPTAFAAYPLAE